jgi:hypothetical protein
MRPRLVPALRVGDCPRQRLPSLQGSSACGWQMHVCMFVLPRPLLAVPASAVQPSAAGCLLACIWDPELNWSCSWPDGLHSPDGAAPGPAIPLELPKPPGQPDDGAAQPLLLCVRSWLRTNCLPLIKCLGPAAQSGWDGHSVRVPSFCDACASNVKNANQQGSSAPARFHGLLALWRQRNIHGLEVRNMTNFRQRVRASAMRATAAHEGSRGGSCL